jgi:hypothetical protein
MFATLSPLRPPAALPPIAMPAIALSRHLHRRGLRQPALKLHPPAVPTAHTRTAWPFPPASLRGTQLAPGGRRQRPAPIRRLCCPPPDPLGKAPEPRRGPPLSRTTQVGVWCPPSCCPSRVADAGLGALRPLPDAALSMAAHDPLCRALVLDELGGAFDFAGSWRATYIAAASGGRPHLVPPRSSLTLSLRCPPVLHSGERMVPFKVNCTRFLFELYYSH